MANPTLPCHVKRSSRLAVIVAQESAKPFVTRDGDIPIGQAQAPFHLRHQYPVLGHQIFVRSSSSSPTVPVM